MEVNAIAKTLLRRQVNLERVVTAVATPSAVQATNEIFPNIKTDAFGSNFSWWSWTWGLLSAGECAMSNGTLVYNSDGGASFSCQLTSADLGDDAWGILHIDFYFHGTLLLSQGPFWSPTINRAGQEWDFGFAIPPYIAAIVDGVTITNHC